MASCLRGLRCQLDARKLIINANDERGGVFLHRRRRRRRRRVWRAIAVAVGRFLCERRARITSRRLQAAATRVVAIARYRVVCAHSKARSIREIHFTGDFCRRCC